MGCRDKDQSVAPRPTVDAARFKPARGADPFILLTQDPQDHGYD
jgi:hypothetical protein